MEYRLYEEIKNAYEASTASTNFFKQMIESVKWDSTFYADGEFYFVKNGLTITTPSLDPFNMSWKPAALFADGSLLSF